MMMQKFINDSTKEIIKRRFSRIAKSYLVLFQFMPIYFLFKEKDRKFQFGLISDLITTRPFFLYLLW